MLKSTRNASIYANGVHSMEVNNHTEKPNSVIFIIQKKIINKTKT